MKKKFLPFFLCIGMCFAAGAIGSIATFPAIGTWYVHLHKPSFTPPNWVFGPVWTTLYFLMGVALYAVVKEKGKKQSERQKQLLKLEKKRGIIFFGAQLSLNTLWSLLFFGFKSPMLGLITILALWIFIFLTMKSFFAVKKISGILLVPYFAWVSFAMILNIAIVLLNR